MQNNSVFSLALKSEKETNERIITGGGEDSSGARQQGSRRGCPCFTGERIQSAGGRSAAVYSHKKERRRSQVVNKNKKYTCFHGGYWKVMIINNIKDPISVFVRSKNDNLGNTTLAFNAKKEWAFCAKFAHFGKGLTVGGLQMRTT
ncbi:hypothetical protein LXL04_034999 [Taraxacum kok-saghyz]